MRSAYQKGFTLLEILVVLVLAAMISGLLLQGMEQTFRLQRHFGQEAFNTGEGEMLSNWFRESIRGLLTDYNEGRNHLKGDPKQLRGLSASALASEGGAPLWITWRIEYDPDADQTLLRYGEGEHAPVILSWPGKEGKFVYLDTELQNHESWPPPLGLWPQLPAAIVLETTRQGAAWSIVASPAGPQSPPVSRAQHLFAEKKGD